MKYQVRSARQGDGQVRVDILEATSEASLREALATQGHTLLTVKPLSAVRAGFKGNARHRFPLFCREIRTLILAGMTIVEAVETLSAKAKLEGASDDLSAGLLTGLQKGQSLSTAMAALPDAPVVLLAAVRAGERTSNLVEALDDYLKYDTLVAQLRGKLISAAIYPGMVTSLGGAISLFLLMVVMPNFAQMYDNLRGPVTGATTLVIGVSKFMSQHRAEALLVLFGATILVISWVRSGGLKRALIRLSNSNAWLRSRLEDFELAMMYQALALLLKGGYPMTESMLVAARSALSPRLQGALNGARAEVERGGSVSQALAGAKLCDEVGRRLMAAAERNGDFYVAAEVVSRLHSARFELFVERLTRIVEPVLLLGVALMVGGIVIAMYLPVFNIAAQLH